MLLVVACSGGSGSTALYGDTDGAADGSTNPDASPTPDSGPQPQGLCPAQAPAQGTPCTTAGLTCEFGGTGPGLLCSTSAACNGEPSPKWFVNAASPSCVPDRGHNPSACPATFGALADGSACPSGVSSGCVYDEGLCGCTTCSGDGGTQQQWSCKVYPKPAGCPEPRPPVGSGCATENQQCSYGGLCSVLSGLPSLLCEDGHWTRQAMGALCALPACGVTN